MQIYPHDLGTKQQMTVIRFRAGAMSGQQAAAMTAAPEPGARPGFLGRLWSRGTGVREDVAAHSLYAMRGVVGGFVGGFVGGSTGFWIPGIIAATQGQPVLGAVFTTLGAAFA